MVDDVRAVGRERSPNYPGMGLPAAIELARKLWQAEKRTTVPAEVAARAIGYNSISGASRAALAALRQYGLIDAAGGAFTISDLAVDILVHDVGSAEYAEAIREAAQNPDIFRELRQTHSDASDSAINAYLISKRRFSTEGAQRLIRAFRETSALVSRVGEGYTEASQSTGDASVTSMSPPSGSPNVQSVANAGVSRMQFLLGGGVRADITFVGGEPEPSHIQKLEAYLKVTREALENP